MHECRKFEKALLDATLGAVAPERERAFTAHIAQCEPCRKAYEQARQIAVAVDRGVESLVAGEPSPHFAARLHARMAGEQPAPRFAWLEWKPAAAALALACILAVAGIVWIATHRNPAPNAIPSAREIAAVPTPSSQVGSAAKPHSGAPASLQARSSLSAQVPTEPGRAGSSRAVQSGSVAVARLAPRRHTGLRANSPAEPEVIVPPGQLEAVMQLAAAIRSGQIDGKQLLAAQKDVDKPIQIPPLEIAPIEIPPQPPVPANGSESSEAQSESGKP